MGRKKELIVTAGGKKIVPENIENKLKASAHIAQAVLVGEGKPYCAAILTLNEECVRAHFRALGIELGQEYYRDRRVRDQIWREVEEINKGLASFETVKKVYIAPEEFTVENGFLTPTFKIKRKTVTSRYFNEIESLYSASEA